VRKSNKRRAKKAKDREKRVRKNRESLSAKRKLKEADAIIRHFAPLPEFKLDVDGATSDIRDLVMAGIERFKSGYTRSMHMDAIELMAGHTRMGWDELIDDLVAADPDDDMPRVDIDRSLRHLFDREIGNGILWGAPPNLIRRALPMSCFTIKPEEKHWLVECRSLSSRRTSHGTLYGSPHQPTVEFNGDSHKVLFTRHALEQMGERIVPNWNKFYIGQAYVFGFLYECVHFEPLYLGNGQAAFAVYNSCLRAGREIRTFMRELLGVETDKELSSHYYRVGYCPLTLDKDMAVAKTFLTPGYWQTPERKTLAAKGSRRLKLVIEQASDDGINTMTVSESKSTRTAVKWFHTHGVPQVKKIEGEVFRNMVGPYSFLKRYDLD